MALETIKATFGRGLKDVFGTGSGKLRNILKELQGLKITRVAGAAADTNIAVTGIATTDTLLSVLVIDTAAAAGSGITDLTSETAITSAGNIQHDTTSSSGKDVLVFWYDKA